MGRTWPGGRLRCASSATWAATPLLTFLWWWALVGRVHRPLALAAVISILYACSDEYHQTFTDNRSGTAVDVGIDAVGIGLACLAISWRWPRPASREPTAAQGSAG